jgi:hypothetical protein
VIDEKLIEQLAEAVHESYLREQLADGATLGTTAALRSWDELDPGRKDANRAQARDIAAKVHRVGGDVVPVLDAPGSFAFTDTEIEQLAREEHDRWSAERTASGWSHGVTRDEAARTHPSLVDWADLSDAEKDKDRDAVRNIPAVLATVGLGVVRPA